VGQFYPPPNFPLEAFKAQQQGVVVSEVTTGDKGNVVSIRILESPARLISDATRKALSQWHFPPLTQGGKPLNAIGKITLYFLIIDGAPKVLSAKDAAASTQGRREPKR
jgi:TonB family protein